ncbi:MAG: DUF4426 domain-containing protein [Candidatus Obscuribacterales bacterium]|nr:DUF4426 domain-containing protein [Steroidobacteraceae bacterium]
MLSTKISGSHLTFCAVCVAALLTVGCGPRPAGSAAPAQLSEESFKEFGDFELHYNAVRTDHLSAEVARSYGIQRSKNRVILNVTMLHKEADHAPRKPVEGVVAVDAYNLNGQLKSMEIRRVNEGDAIYYIGEVAISGNEILVFDIKATPSKENTALSAKFKREFFTD